MLFEIKDAEFTNIINLIVQNKKHNGIEYIVKNEPNWQEKYKQDPALKLILKLKTILDSFDSNTMMWFKKMLEIDPEPLEELTSVLRLYNKYKREINKPLKSFNSIGDLRKAIEQLSLETTDKNNNFSNYEIVYKSENWVVLYPRSEEESIQIANSQKITRGGVQWCTAATKSENYFDSYSGTMIIHLYYCLRIGGNSIKNPNDKISIGVRNGKIEYFENCTVNSINADLYLKHLRDIFGEEWDSICAAILNDAQSKKFTPVQLQIKEVENLTLEQFVNKLKTKDEKSIRSFLYKVVQYNKSPDIIKYIYDNFIVKTNSALPNKLYLSETIFVETEVDMETFPKIFEEIIDGGDPYYIESIADNPDILKFPDLINKILDLRIGASKLLEHRLVKSKTLNYKFLKKALLDEYKISRRDDMYLGYINDMARLEDLGKWPDIVDEISKCHDFGVKTIIASKKYLANYPEIYKNLSNDPNFYVREAIWIRPDLSKFPDIKQKLSQEFESSDYHTIS